jgi:hypothetical protein
MSTRKDPQAAVLADFQSGGTLTVYECLKKHHTTELRRIVNRLRGQGYNIVSTWEKNEDGAHKRFRLEQTEESAS